MQTSKERRGSLPEPGRPAGFRVWSGGPGPLLVALLSPRPETQGRNAGALPSQVTSYRHRAVFSAKQTKRKEGQQDISSFFRFSMADVSGNQHSEWNQRGFQFAGILLPGCKSRASGEAFVQKSLPDLSAHAQKSTIRALLLWHKPHMSFCLLSPKSYI